MQERILYREIESLKEYVMIAPDRASVECYIRQADGRWLLQEYQSLEQTATFESINVTVELSEIYRNVAFHKPDETDLQPKQS